MTTSVHVRQLTRSFMLNIEKFASWRRENAVKWRDLRMIPAIIVAGMFRAVVASSLHEHSLLPSWAIWVVSLIIAVCITVALLVAFEAAMDRRDREQSR